MARQVPSAFFFRLPTLFNNPFYEPAFVSLVFVSVLDFLVAARANGPSDGTEKFFRCLSFRNFHAVVELAADGTFERRHLAET